MTRSQICLPANQYLFREGETGDQAWLVDRGCLLIERHGDNGPEWLGEVGPGECVGEMALISSSPRLASARAIEECELTLITREHLNERLERSDPLVRHLLQIVLKRYRSALGHFPESGLADDAQDETQAINRMRTEHALSTALQHGEFRLFFQPIVRLEDRSTSGFEALLRWRKPNGELVAPDLFIPVAEESHIIEAIGHWIIQEAVRCRALLRERWKQSLDENFSVSVNLAARQFYDSKLVTVIRQALQDHQMPAAQLRLEVTESQLLKDFEQVMQLLEQLKSLGCKVAVDDFGTGHSSLAYLHKLPVDTLKIDKTFLNEMETQPASRHIIANMAHLARDLKLSFIAEGAETEAQVKLLEQLGVEQVQGFYFGRPFGLDPR